VIRPTWREAIRWCLCLRYPKPAHYTDIAKWIDDERLRRRIENPEATVNRIIRISLRDDPDSPFRDVGDGMYGLSDMGERLCGDREMILEDVRLINRRHDRLDAVRRRLHGGG